MRPARERAHAPSDPSPWRIGPIRSNRRLGSGSIPAYLVLLRVGFTVPRPSLDARCALTAPFHPYPGRCPPARLREPTATGAVCFLLHWPSSRLDATVPDVIRHTALWSSDFPPPRNTGLHRPSRQRSPGRLHTVILPVPREQSPNQQRSLARTDLYCGTPLYSIYTFSFTLPLASPPSVRLQLSSCGGVFAS